MDKETPRDPVDQLITELKRLPGIGAKSAQRIAFHLIRRPEEECQRLARAVGELKARLVLCSRCNNISASDPCRICSDATRDGREICIVEEPFNVISIEKSGQYRGRYHVLHGALSPINGIGPEDLKIKNLFDRLRGGEVEEVIVATNPTIEGEATALYLSRLIKPLEIKVSRIAFGIPIGSDLEYADEVTISRAISARQAL